MALSFSTQPRHTLLLVTPWQIARLDFAGYRKPKLLQVWCVSNSIFSRGDNTIGLSSEPSVAVGVARALQLGPKRLGKVSLVSTFFWTDVLNLPSDVALMASPSEVQQALAIEAELDSGMSAMDAQVACRPLHSQTLERTHFCVTQIANTQLAELHELIQARGSRLIALAHPIALHPIALASSTELGTSESAAKILQEWAEIPADSQTGTDRDSNHRLEYVANNFSNLLGKRNFPSLWLQPKQEPKLHHLIASAAVLVVATTLSCAVMSHQKHRQIESLQQSIMQMQSQLAEHEKLAAVRGQLEKELVKLRQEEKAAREAKETTEQKVRLASRLQRQLNARWGLLFDALAANSEECWIRSIDSDSMQTTLHGIAMDSTQAHAYTARLENALRGSGWLVSPAITRSSQLGLCEFSIALHSDFSETPPQEVHQSIVLLQTKAVDQLGHYERKLGVSP